MRLLSVVVLVFGFVVGACANDVSVNVYVNGKLQKYKPPARIRDGKIYVPLRQGAESLGFSAEWLAEQNMAKVCDESACLMIRKSAGIVVEGRLFLPLRRMGEAFGATVMWDAKKRAVIITKERKRLE